MEPQSQEVFQAQGLCKTQSVVRVVKVVQRPGPVVLVNTAAEVAGAATLPPSDRLPEEGRCSVLEAADAEGLLQAEIPGRPERRVDSLESMLPEAAGLERRLRERPEQTEPLGMRLQVPGAGAVGVAEPGLLVPRVGTAGMAATPEAGLAAEAAGRMPPVELAEQVGAARATSSPTSDMRIHLLGLPNAPVSPDYCLCGFAQATVRFSRMMRDQGHEVLLYGAEGSNSPCSEFIQIMTEEERTTLLGNCEYQHAVMDDKYALWQLSNPRIIRAIKERRRSGDIVCSIGGASQKPVADALPDMVFVEYSIGYTGNFSPFRVFESYAWKHYCYGQQSIIDNRYYDTVIPVFFDPMEYPTAPKEDYVVFCGRLVERKGIGIACDAAREAGVPLKVMGHGNPKLVTYGEYLGAPDSKTRNEVLSKARATLCPTVYIEPFCCVSVESQLCRTPVICPDAGGFVENVKHGMSGFRCNMFRDFVQAIRDADALPNDAIRSRAVDLYSMSRVAPQYDDYFARLATLQVGGGGWYSK